jgi:hypothetical protein
MVGSLCSERSVTMSLQNGSGPRLKEPNPFAKLDNFESGNCHHHRAWQQSGFAVALSECNEESAKYRRQTLAR